MNDNSTPHVDAAGNPIPVYPIQVRLARLAILGLVVMFICLQFFGGAVVSVETKGEATIYTSESSLDLIFFAFPVITGILAIVYSLQPSIFRFFGAALVLITAWLTYTAFTMDASNHNVTVTPTAVSREVGTTSDPMRHEIDFTKTAYLYIDQVPGDHGPKYELVANAATDGAETRVPIFDMMRSALPQIMETASKQNVMIGESTDGSVIPAALRVNTGK
jgi:hypothetical protein